MTETLAPVGPGPAEVGGNPYVGPRAIGYGEPIYGRAREIGELRDLLIAERIVLLYSPSGAGKSSLLGAGLRPVLEQHDFWVLPVIRVGHEPPETTDPETIRNRYLLSTLASLEEARPLDQRLSDADLASIGLEDYLGQVTAPGAPDLDPCLVFDQFEELFTLDPTDLDAKAAFLDELGRALRDKRRWALFAMREDFIAQLDPYVARLPTRLGNRYRLELLSAEAAEVAARFPAAAAGVDFTVDAAERLVDDLRTVRVERGPVVTDELGPSVEPVQLQVVCRQLWSRLPEDARAIEVADVTALGNVDHALADFYADQVAEVAARTGVSQREVRDWFDDRLITEQGFRTQVHEGPGVAGPAVLRGLEDAHLIRAEHRRGTDWYELSHDRLVEPIRENNARWRDEHLSALQREAQHWDELSRQGPLMTGDVLVGAQAWAAAHDAELLPVDLDYLEACRTEQGRAEREHKAARRNKVLAVVATVVGAVALLGLIVALLAWRRAADQERRANAATLQAEDATEREALARQDAVARGASDAWLSLGESATGDPRVQLVSWLRAYRAAPAAGAAAASPELSRRLATARHFLEHDPAHLASAAALDRTGQHLVRGTEDGRLELVDVDSLVRTALAPVAGSIVAVGPSEVDDRLAVAERDGDQLNVAVRDSASSSALSMPQLAADSLLSELTIAGRPGVVAGLAVDPATGVGPLLTWDAASGDPLPVPDASAIRSFAVSAEGNWLAASDQDRGLVVWQRGGGSWQTVALPVTWRTDFEAALVFDGGRPRLAVAAEDLSVHVIELPSGSDASFRYDQGLGPSDLVFLADGGLRVVDRNGFLGTWTEAVPGVWAPAPLTATAVTPGAAIRFSPDGRRVLVTEDQGVTVADASTGSQLLGANAAALGDIGATRTIAGRTPRPHAVDGADSIVIQPAGSAATTGWQAVPGIAPAVALGLSRDGSTAASSTADLGFRVMRADGTVTAVEVPCPLAAGARTVPGPADGSGIQVAVADGGSVAGLLDRTAACIWRPGSGEPWLLSALPGQELRGLAISATGTAGALASDWNGAGLIEPLDITGRTVGEGFSLPGLVGAVAVSAGGEVTVAGDDRGNVIVDSERAQATIALPALAPVVAVDVVSTDDTAIVAAATAMAVYVYRITGNTTTLIGGYDLLRGEGDVVDLSLASEHELGVLGSDLSWYVVDVDEPADAVATRVEALVGERGWSVSTDDCQRLLAKDCPTG